MTARRIARELAVIMMPQLPKDKKRLEKLDFDNLLCKSVQILTEHAKQCLSEANGYLVKANQEIQEIELEHPSNARRTADVAPVMLKSSDLKDQIDLIGIAINLVSEALDIPEMVIASDLAPSKIKCESCGKEQKFNLRRAASHDVKHFLEQLIGGYTEHSKEIDQIIGAIKSKWRLDRMVSIDRDILRLACTEAFFMPDIPVKVAISEAVELAHRFADERAAKFINGVLADLSGEAENFRLTGEFKISHSEDNKNEESPRKAPVGG